MAVLKCKMCSGDLEIEEGKSVAVCEYCGTKQTVPTLDNERKESLFGRAGRLLRACEFDKASVVFGDIVSEFPEEAEAYWGLLLCKYGVEYVDDPASGKKIPTCHRLSFESVMEDSDFEQVMENADSVARGVYREEAKFLENLRKNVIEVSSKEEPYDVFICYKETAADGGRTVDSVMAQDIYDALTAKGLRVFFARITLEDKLGMEYEPYIFAALNSAKVMLAIGTDYEYFNAVWVKNEWSRYLKLIAKGEKKVLIPCYKDIDAYDMPKEFKNLQAQDMGKLGYIQDLVRGVCKIVGVEEKKETVIIKETVVNQNKNEVELLLKRVDLFLEDRDWKSANEYCEKVLDSEPENAQAYLGKLMAELRVSKKEYLRDCEKPFDDRNNYQKVKRFGDDELRAELEKYNEIIKERLENLAKQRADRIAEEERKFEAERKETLEKAKELLENAKEYSDYVQIFDSLEKYREDKEIAEFLSEVIEAERKGTLKKAKELFERTEKYSDYLQISDSLEKYREDKEIAEFLSEVKEAKEKALKPIIKCFSNRIKELDDNLLSYRSNVVALKADGTVVATNNDSSQYEVSGWKDIIAISCGKKHTVGLKADGTVVAVGLNDKGQCNVSDWKDIVAITCGDSFTAGLKSDGTVVATGDVIMPGSSFKDMTSILGVDNKIYGVRSDGKLLRTYYEGTQIFVFNGVKAIFCIKGYSLYGYGIAVITENGNITVIDRDNRFINKEELSEFKNIEKIVGDDGTIVGLKSDGTVVIKSPHHSLNYSFGKCKDIVDIAYSGHKAAVLKTDGTVELESSSYEKYGADKWKNIVAIYSGNDSIYGLKSDGTIVSTNNNDKAINDAVKGWKLFNSVDEAIKQEEKRLAAINGKREALRKEINEPLENEKALLEKEKAELETELAGLSGFFSGLRKSNINSRLTEIKSAKESIDKKIAATNKKYCDFE